MTYPSIPNFDIVAKIQRKVSKEGGTFLVDNRKEFENFLAKNPYSFLFAPDNVHPNALGYRLIAEGIYKAMKENESYIGIKIKNLSQRKDEPDKKYLSQLINDLKKKSKEQMDSPYYHDALGNLYTEIGDYDDAIAEFEKAFSLAPHDSTFFRALVVLYIRIGNKNKVEETIKKAIQFNPDSKEFLDLIFRFRRGTEKELTIF